MSSGLHLMILQDACVFAKTRRTLFGIREHLCWVKGHTDGTHDSNLFFFLLVTQQYLSTGMIRMWVATRILGVWTQFQFSFISAAEREFLKRNSTPLCRWRPWLRTLCFFRLPCSPFCLSCRPWANFCRFALNIHLDWRMILLDFVHSNVTI